MFLAAAIAIFAIPQIMAQETLRCLTARFSSTDNPSYSSPTFNDSEWRYLILQQPWGAQNEDPATEYGWYRLHFSLTPEMKQRFNRDAKILLLDIGKIDDADQTFLNGKLVGETGAFPTGDKPYVTAWDQHRRYTVPLSSNLLNPDGDNVLAIRVYNGNGDGGKYGTPIKISLPTDIDGAELSFSESPTAKGRNLNVTLTRVEIPGLVAGHLKGTLKVDFFDCDNDRIIASKSKKFNLSSAKPHDFEFDAPEGNIRAMVTLTNASGKQSVTHSYPMKYILTPAAPESPRFNTAPIYGVRPGSPIHFRFGVSGNRPMTFTADGLPQGVKLNPVNGALSGSVSANGDYTFTVTATNDKGSASQKFTLRVGDKIALTPPMGWNSWNCWGLSVSQDKVLASAQSLIDKGLADYGYSYINIDDGWEAPERAVDGTIVVNEKFPSIKQLADQLHDEGLKIGIYSSPGAYTCGHYLGSLGHEKQDAQSYNEWGIDYLKYDWCDYNTKHSQERDRGTLASYIRPYMLMGEYLRSQPRDIFYSLCQYGMANVGKWGPMVDANSWRTTGDIEDTWESMSGIGFFQQKDLYPYAAPGGWNDPDMLVVGKVGWGPRLHDSNLTPDEQYTHISLWSLLAANMLIGCPIDQLDDFTINLLCNNEVNAVNQDILGKQARPVVVDGDIQVWARPLADGSQAVGVFNLGNKDATVDFSGYFEALGIKEPSNIRDLWRQTDLHDAEWKIPTHGVRLLKVTP